MRSTKLKKCRMELKEFRSALRNQRENSEGITYATSCTILSEPAIDHNSTIEWKIQENDDNMHRTLHPYLYERVQQLFPRDLQQWINFCKGIIINSLYSRINLKVKQLVNIENMHRILRAMTAEFVLSRQYFVD